MQSQQLNILRNFKSLNIAAGCDPAIVELCLAYMRYCFSYGYNIDFNHIYPPLQEMFADPQISAEQITYLNQLITQAERFRQLDEIPLNCIHLHLWYCYNLLRNGCIVLFSPSDLAEHLGISLQVLYFFASDKGIYIDFEVPKRDGKSTRHISAPILPLRQIQRWLLDNILSMVPLSNHATAYIQGKSIFDNASSHIQANVVINIDLKDFFPSITFQRVIGLYLNLGYIYPVATLLAQLSCHNNQIPQGAPTSPAISNILCRRLDNRLSKLGEKLAFRYTRYADDITFSGNRFVNSFMDSVKRIIADEGFEINERKTRITYSGKAQKVTGLVVNEKVNIPRDYYRRLRAVIHNCQQLGVESQTDQEVSVFKAKMYGHAHYIHSINPEKGRYLLEQLDKIEW